MWIFNSKTSVGALSLFLLACGSDGKKAEEAPQTLAFQKGLLLSEFSGEPSPACGERHVEKEKKALALLELGFQGLSLAEYRRCYKKEFLK